MPDQRPDWDQYFLDICDAVGQRADCRRRKAGAVIVKDNRIVATGYNGAPAGKPGCLDGACPRGLLDGDQVAAYSSYDTGPGACISIHAEGNALLHSEYERVRGGTIYTTPGRPCLGCAKLVAGSGLVRVVWRENGEIGEYLVADWQPFG